jgi:predicted flap endonuclease-1-like 5' DNA nuclease
MAVPLAASAGAVAVAGAIRKKQLALQETSTQLASVQEEQAALTTAKADLETELQTQVAALEEAKAQLEAIQQQLDAANAAHADELQVLDQKTAELQAKYNEAEATRLELQAKVEELTADQEAAMALLAERDSAVQEVETKLEAVTLPQEKTVSDFKAAARAAAESRGVAIRTTTDLQDLSQLKHIGVTFEQRLYRAGAGTFWEVAHLTDDDLALILRLTEMQQLAMDTNEVRTDAVRLAEESDTVGVLSEGETPDDFEPIQGIGKIFEQRLYSAGIRTYRQLAEMSEQQLADICQARKPLVPDYASWIRQARIFLEVRSSK